jgi:hypothetical protein
MSREPKANPALNFVRGDDRELGDTGNLLTLPEWHSSILAIPQNTKQTKTTRTKDRWKVFLPKPSHYPREMQESGIVLFACVFIGIIMCTLP